MTKSKLAPSSRFFVVLVLSMLILSYAQSQTVTFSSTGLSEIKRTQQWSPTGQTSELALNQSLRILQGSATLSLSSGTLKLDENTELEYSAEGFKLVKGQAYLEGSTTFNAGSYSFLAEGKSRLDQVGGIFRIANLEGVISYTNQAGELWRLGQGQQMTVEPASLSIGAFFEYDPWYKARETLSLKEATVLGYLGQAAYWTNNSWQSVSLNQMLAAGDRLKTQEDSWLELKTDQNLIRLQANTELELVKLESTQLNLGEEGSQQENTLALNLISGSVWLVIESENQNLQITTPGLIAGARGTTFRVIADTFDPTIKAFDGIVYGVTGFATVNIPERKQFGTQTGLVDLVIDDTDQFNLDKDVQGDSPFLGICEPVFNDEGAFVECKDTP